MEIEELGPTKLAGVAERASHPGLAFGSVMRAMESEERSVFERYGGKYVDSGDLRASLTSVAASGAIRILTPWGGVFGSSVWYGKFQGTQGPGSHRPPSAILRATEAEARLASRSLLEYILHGGRP
jgi:hypothetical protein